MGHEFDTLLRFLQSEMRMSHIYQPLMLRTLLQAGGMATTRQIAAAFLAEDESQLEYYEAITNRMPGRCSASTALWSVTATDTPSLPK